MVGLVGAARGGFGARLDVGVPPLGTELGTAETEVEEAVLEAEPAGWASADDLMGWWSDGEDAIGGKTRAGAADSSRFTGST